MTESKQRKFRQRRAPIAIAVLVLVVVMAAFKVMPIAALALLAAVLVIMCGCLSPEDAYQAIDWKILFLIFGMLAIGFAVEETGGAKLIAEGVLNVVGDLHPMVIISIIYLMTVIITELISNNATAVLLTPLVVQMANQMDLDAKPLVVAVMFGASACFATPIGYQTNTYVYGAGGYKFSDFPKVGPIAERDSLDGCHLGYPMVVSFWKPKLNRECLVLHVTTCLKVTGKLITQTFPY